MSPDPITAQSPANNVVLRQLQGLRREMVAMLEREDRTQRLVVRLDRHMEARFAEMRASSTEIRSDAVLQENTLLNRHNEILDVLRRLEAIEAGDEPVSESDGPAESG